MSMTIDFMDFDRGFAKVAEKVSEKEAGKGLFKAGNQLLRDAEEEQPYAPYELGDLRGSGRTTKAEVKEGEVFVVAGFNIKYAARWHELTPEEDGKISWTTPGSGRKYLESKMARYKDKYMKIVAMHIARVLLKGVLKGK